MLAKVFSSSLLGIDAILVEVEVDISPGLPQFATVGLPDGAVKESKDRVKSGLKNSGYPFPNRKITCNLAPADLKKDLKNFAYCETTTVIDNTAMVNENEAASIFVSPP